MLELTIILACFALILWPAAAAGDEKFESEFDIPAMMQSILQKLSFKR